MSITERLFSILYRRSSDYGNNLLYPIAWFFGLLFCVWLPLIALAIFLSTDGSHKILMQAPDFGIWKQALREALVSSFIPFRSLANFEGELPWWGYLVIVTQGFTSVWLASVFALTLRWKFKRD